MKSVFCRSKNPDTNIVHGLLNEKVTPIQLYKTVCNKISGINWLKANNQKITCKKCLSELPRNINDGYL